MPPGSCCIDLAWRQEDDAFSFEKKVTPKKYGFRDPEVG